MEWILESKGQIPTGKEEAIEYLSEQHKLGVNNQKASPEIVTADVKTQGTAYLKLNYREEDVETANYTARLGPDVENVEETKDVLDEAVQYLGGELEWEDYRDANSDWEQALDRRESSGEGVSPETMAEEWLL